MNEESITSLLGEIRDNQRRALDQQNAHLEIARSHFEQAKAQIATSLKLQQEGFPQRPVLGALLHPGHLVRQALILQQHPEQLAGLRRREGRDDEPLGVEEGRLERRFVEFRTRVLMGQRASFSG